MLEDILRSYPALISKIELAVQKADVGKEKINLEAIERRISYAVSGNLDYYHIDGAVDDLEEIYKMAESLEEKSKFKDAAEVYSRLVEGCTNAYNIGADDSNGNMGDLAHSCVESFNECMGKVDDQGFKDAMLLRVADLYEREDYGLETEDMFSGVVTETNIKKIEDELHRQLDDYLKKHKKRDRFFSNYKKKEVKEILAGLYEKIGHFDDALEIARSEMESIEDHLLTADMLIRAGRYDDALETLRNCSKFKDSKRRYGLAEVYLRLTEALMREGQSENIDIQEAIEYAVILIAPRPWSFEHEEFDRIKSLFKKLDTHERFVSTAKKKLAGTSALVEFLLHEEDIVGAAEILGTVKEISGGLAIQVAAKAKNKGLTDIAMRTTALALKSGYSRPYRGTKTKELVLIRELLSSASREELDDLVSNLNVDDSLSIFMAEELATKTSGLALRVLKDDIEAYKASDLMRIVDKLTESGPDDAKYLADLWISKFVMRSHVYYDDAVKMLGLVKKAVVKAEGGGAWKKYISSFEMKYRTRKRLIEKLRGAHLIQG